ncbi:MAG: diaminopimelate decarboxylase [Clostridia bacterium]|nr:diaminopimelate decarboxylase [Clostridia bacterium]
MVSDSLAVNSLGHLTCGGADCVDLAKTYGTPLYVFDEGLIRKTCRDFKRSIDEYYGGNGQVLYASKAFSCKEIYRIVSSEGLGADVVSAGEIYTALAAGFDPANLFFHGNNKTPEEIAYAIKNGVGRIVVDNMTELDTIEALAKENGAKVRVILRIKPGIDAHTHNFIRTGQIDSKFGFALENGEAMEAAEKTAKYENLILMGFHCHIGSQIFTTEPFKAAARVMIGFMDEFREKTGIVVPELNLGGGFGVKYLDSDGQLPFEVFMQEVSSTMKEKAASLDYPMPRIYIEPGRAIVGPAGLTLYTVGCVKSIENIRTYVSVDGGMSDNPRYALYQSDYDIIIANKADQKKNYIATVAGKCCESGDLIQEHAPMQHPEVGDILAVMTTGAYNYSMASNYNRIPRPMAVMIRDGVSRVIIRRETFEDLIRNDL